MKVSDTWYICYECMYTHNFLTKTNYSGLLFLLDSFKCFFYWYLIPSLIHIMSGSVSGGNIRISSENISRDTNMCNLRDSKKTGNSPVCPKPWNIHGAIWYSILSPCVITHKMVIISWRIIISGLCYADSGSFGDPILCIFWKFSWGGKLYTWHPICVIKMFLCY